jgi:release factor glutamine methyltransferase
MALHLKHLRIIASDLSPEALQLARVNAERHGVAERIEFLEGDLLSPLLDLGLAGRVDIIASNPPYVPAAEIALLQREVRDFEPAVALNGGEDGLDFYRRLLLDCPEFLKPGGCLVFEIGFSQLDAIRRLIDPERWSLEKVTGDLQGIPRTVTLRNRGRR